MLQLSLMRHANSDCNNYNGNDFDRAISKIGIKKTILVSEYLKKKKYFLI